MIRIEISAAAYAVLCDRLRPIHRTAEVDVKR